MIKVEIGISYIGMIVKYGNMRYQLYNLIGNKSKIIEDS